MDILILGGSGFLSGTLAREALGAGHRVWVVTRGQKPLVQGVVPITADRKVPGRLGAALGQPQPDSRVPLPAQWDLVVDCIGFDAADARQDVRVFAGQTTCFVFISTDFVMDPDRRQFPQSEEALAYATTGYGAGKRAAEEVFLATPTDQLPWTVLRPCHIYGPGSQLGCLPQHGRDSGLLARIAAGETLHLVGGGHFLQQPVYAPDLAQLILSCAGNPRCAGQIAMAPGPETVESKTYYQIIGEIVGQPVNVAEIPVSTFRAEHPEAAPFLCHRVYSHAKLAAMGLKVPSTPLRQGLEGHVAALQATNS